MIMRRLHLGILLLTLLLVAGGILGYSLFKNGIFPVARVNGSIIFYNDIRDNLAVSRKLYSQSVDFTALELEEEEADKLKRLFEGSEVELFEKVFEGLIENTIIKTSVSPELLQEAKERMAESLASTDQNTLNASLKLVYGWDLEKFSERIFKPQALQELLLEQKGDEFDEWLREARSGARVSIWFLPLAWRDGQLVNK